jgi:hypothetical protein
MEYISGKTKILFFIWILCIALCPVFGEDLIEIKIKGELYTHSYPESLDEAYDLLDAIAQINNTGDDAFVLYQKITEEEEAELRNKIAQLEKYNKEIEQKLANISKSNDEIGSYINKEINKPREWMVLGSIGEAISVEDGSLGNSLSLGFLKNLHLFNLYAGLNLATNIYYKNNNMRDIGLSIYLGMFIN